MGARTAAERFLNIEVECGLLMAIGDGMGEVGISVYSCVCRRRRRHGRRHGRQR